MSYSELKSLSKDDLKKFDLKKLRFPVLWCAIRKNTSLTKDDFKDGSVYSSIVGKYLYEKLKNKDTEKYEYIYYGKITGIQCSYQPVYSSQLSGGIPWKEHTLMVSYSNNAGEGSEFVNGFKEMYVSDSIQPDNANKGGAKRKSRRRHRKSKSPKRRKSIKNT